ncbi:MAG: GNAT family N-acetyltransferase [Proteobacteria bacterium]|nr:GNAT family N-acetyltransferase [Pseudomonadota bacterium]
MPGDAAAAKPYHAERYDLGPASSGHARTLTPLAPGEATILGAELAQIDPWLAYRSKPGELSAFFAATEEAASRRAIRLDGQLAGIVVMRSPWLAGPYLHFLAVLPPFQGHGLGQAVLDWIRREAPAGTRNLWLCVSAINTRARQLYERNGYVLAAELPALAADHIDELLLRRRLY